MVVRSLIAATLLLLACSGGGNRASNATDPRPDVSARAEPRATARTSAAPLVPAEPPSAAASIFDKRKLYLGGADAGASCEAWDIEIPDMLDDTRAKLRRPAPEGDVRVTVDVERRGAELQIGAPCFGIAKASVCLSCPEGTIAVRAYARLDDCEEGATDRSATVTGCVTALGSGARANARRMFDGSLRDELVKRIEAARLVSRGDGDGCIEQHVRKSGKRLFLDWSASEYPEELTRLSNGALAIEEVPEKNPRYRPTGGLGAIGIGCCDSHQYYVLDVTKERAMLRTIPHPGSKEPARVEELRLSGCPR
jgi:hypothetical protein